MMREKDLSPIGRSIVETFRRLNDGPELDPSFRLKDPAIGGTVEDLTEEEQRDTVDYVDKITADVGLDPKELIEIAKAVADSDLKTVLLGIELAGTSQELEERVRLVLAAHSFQALLVGVTAAKDLYDPRS
jgi:hypothetical protein